MSNKLNLMGRLNNLFNHFGKNVRIRFCVDFLMNASFTMVVPYLPIYFSQRVGTSLTGIMFAGVILAGIIGGITGGMLADRIGRRKIMLIAEGTTIVTYTLIAFCNSPWWNNVYLTFLLYVISMLFFGMLSPAVSALLIDSSQPEYRKYMYQFQYWLVNLALASGSLIGGFFFQKYYFVLFLLVALSDVIAFLSTLLLITDDFEPVRKSKDGEDNEDPAIKKVGMMQTLFGLIKDRLFVMYFLASFSLATISCQMTNYIAIHMTEAIPRQQLIGSFYLNGMNLLGMLQSENTLLVICCTFMVTFLVQKISQRVTVVAGVMLFALGYVYMMVGTVPLLFFLAMLITTVGELLYVPIGQNFLADLAPDRQRGLYMGIAGLSGSFGMILASLMITFVNILPSAVIVVIVSLFGILAAFLYARLDIGIKEKLKIPAESSPKFKTR